MTVRPIVICGDPVLHQPTSEVTAAELAGAPVSGAVFGGQELNLAELIADMFETMDTANGVGLAANQIGVPKRLFVYDCPGGGRGVVINPQLTTSKIPTTMPADDGEDEEGCLSLPGLSFPTGRAFEATVRGVDATGAPLEVSGTEFFARCLQHEVGHLDGFVYTDVLVGRWKRMARKELKRAGWTTGGLTWMPGVDPDPFADPEEFEQQWQ